MKITINIPEDTRSDVEFTIESTQTCPHAQPLLSPVHLQLIERARATHVRYVLETRHGQTQHYTKLTNIIDAVIDYITAMV